MSTLNSISFSYNEETMNYKNTHTHTYIYIYNLYKFIYSQLKNSLLINNFMNYDWSAKNILLI